MPVAPPYLAIVAAGAVFASLLLACVGVVLYLNKRDKRRQIMVKIKQEGAPIGTSEASSQLAWGGSLLAQAAALLGSLGERLKPRKPEELSQARLKFVRAGFRSHNAVAIFWGAKIFLLILFTVGFLLTRMTLFRLLNVNATLAILSLCLLGGYMLPDLWLRARLKARKRTITLGLPDALDLLVVCMDAGMGIDAAFKRVTDNLSLTNKVLEGEFKNFMLEMKAGKTRQDALKDLAAKADVEELYGLTSLMIQADKLGTSIAQALRIFSEDLRSKRMQRAEEIAATISVKLMLPMMLFIFPSLFVVILGPGIIRVFRIWTQH